MIGMVSTRSQCPPCLSHTCTQFFRAAAADASMVKGAWIFMTECGYVWMAPVRAPGNAYDKGVAGEGGKGGRGEGGGGGGSS